MQSNQRIVVNYRLFSNSPHLPLIFHIIIDVRSSSSSSSLTHQTGFHWRKIQFTIERCPPRTPKKGWKSYSVYELFVARVSISIFPVLHFSLLCSTITLMTLNNKHTWTWSFIRKRVSSVPKTKTESFSSKWISPSPSRIMLNAACIHSK